MCDKRKLKGKEKETNVDLKKKKIAKHRQINYIPGTKKIYK